MRLKKTLIRIEDDGFKIPQGAKYVGAVEVRRVFALPDGSDLTIEVFSDGSYTIIDHAVGAHPVKTTYEHESGEAVDVRGFAIKLQIDTDGNGTEDDVIRVYYDENDSTSREVIVPVEVIPYVKEVEVTPPTNTEYYVTEKFEMAGMKAKLKYSNGEYVKVEDDGSYSRVADSMEATEFLDLTSAPWGVPYYGIRC